MVKNIINIKKVGNMNKSLMVLSFFICLIGCRGGVESEDLQEKKEFLDRTNPEKIKFDYGDAKGLDPNGFILGPHGQKVKAKAGDIIPAEKIILDQFPITNNEYITPFFHDSGECMMVKVDRKGYILQKVSFKGVTLDKGDRVMDGKKQ